jgi:hypothetical protein
MLEHPNVRAWRGAVSLSRQFLLCLCLMLLGAIASNEARAQTTQEKLFDVKPFIPPIIPLPPNAQVTPGGVNLTPSPSDPATVSNPQTPSGAGSGLRITIPTR